MRNEHVRIKRRVAIVTNNLNCERHIQYFSTIEKYFKSNGWEIAENFNVEKVIICCCGFHDVMHEKVLRTIDELMKIHFLQSNIIIMGCQSKTHEPELLKKLSVKLININAEEQLDELINAGIPFAKVVPNNIFRPFKECNIEEKNEFFYIKIAQGCLRQCTFCVINKAKGYIKSVPKEEILEQFRKAIARGNRRIYMMGEDTLAYGLDIDTDIIDLVKSMVAIDSAVELNFGSLHIRWLVKYADDILSLCKRGIVKELHVGLQHVNNEILQRMGRPVDFSEIYKLIKTLKKESPGVFLEADIMVGFPGETEEIFTELLEFFKQDRCFDNIRHFGFSDVKGAPSYKFDNKLTPNEIVVRWERFDKILQERSANFKSANSSTTDLAFQLTHERDYSFCKDTFKDEVDQVVDNTGLRQAKSKILTDNTEDFEF